MKIHFVVKYDEFEKMDAVPNVLLDEGSVLIELCMGGGVGLL